MSFVVVRILISIAISQVLHQLGRRITQMERHRQIASLAHQLYRSIDGFISRVVLLRTSEVDHRLSQGYPPFGPTNLRHSIKGRIGQKKRIRISQSDVFCRTDDDSSRNKLRVFASFYHTSHPIKGRIRVGATYRLDESRHYIIVHLTALIVGQGVLLQSLLHHLIRHNDVVATLGSHD